MDSACLLKNIPGIIEKTFPIPARFRGKLPSDVAELSRFLTSGRGERSLSYLNRPNLLSAYLHYFLPWNLFRLCHLLPSLELPLSANDSVLDLGSGTLTFASALWIARPDLRETPLEFVCVDRSGQALEAGKKFFQALSGESKWKIKLVREEVKIVHGLHGLHGLTRIKKAKLVTAVNLFNEIYENISHNNTDELKRFAKRSAQFLQKQASDDAAFLVVEPGVPQSGRFISFLREAFLELGGAPVAPCAHSKACPLANVASRENTAPARAKKWCHFTIEDFDPPRELARLSAAAKLPKERLVYSYLLMNIKREWREERKENSTLETPPQALEASLRARVISDAFPLPARSRAQASARKPAAGRYGCSEQGLVLLRGEKHIIDKACSGSLITNFSPSNEIDAKSGASILEVK